MVIQFSMFRYILRLRGKSNCGLAGNHLKISAYWALKLPGYQIGSARSGVNSFFCIKCE